MRTTDNPSDSADDPSRGHFFFAGPKAMEVNQSQTVRVWITQDSIQDMPAFLESVGDNDTTLVEAIRVGKIMEVRLLDATASDENFKITPLNSQEQILDKHDAATWYWTVEALRTGAHKLVVIARIKMLTADMQLLGYKDLPVFEREVEVTVKEKVETFSDYFFMAIGFLFMVFIVGLIGRWIWKRFQKAKAIQEITPEKYEAFSEELEVCIEQDKIDAALELLEQFGKQNGLDKIAEQAIHLKSNHFNNRSMFNRNLIDNETFGLNRSKVVSEILGIMREVESSVKQK